MAVCYSVKYALERLALICFVRMQACVPIAQKSSVILGCVSNSSKPKTAAICITLQQLFKIFQVYDSEQLQVSDGNAHVPDLLGCHVLTARKP